MDQFVPPPPDLLQNLQTIGVRGGPPFFQTAGLEGKAPEDVRGFFSSSSIISRGRG